MCSPKMASALLFATQATDHAATNVPQQRFDIALYYNLLYHLRKDRPLLNSKARLRLLLGKRRFGVPSRAFWRTR